MLHTPDQLHQDIDSSRLDYLITRIEDSSELQRDLIVEHLASARMCLLGAMPEEYANNLRMADKAAASLSDLRLQLDLTRTLASLLASVTARPDAVEEQHPQHHHSLNQPSTGPVNRSSTLTAFFRGKDIAHGIFYPTKHIVAVFRSFTLAQAAYNRFQQAGFTRDELLVVHGGEVTEFLEQLRQHTGLWGDLMRNISRLLGTEASLVDRYERWSKQGAGFLVIYCDTEREIEQNTRLLEPVEPLAAHWYMRSFIRHLV